MGKEKLANAIENAREEFMRWREAIGSDGRTKYLMGYTEGMQKAFEIVFGQSYIDYLVDDV